MPDEAVIHEGAFETYRRRTVNRNQRWGWRLRSLNGRILAGSTEGYSDRAFADMIGRAVVTGKFVIHYR